MRPIAHWASTVLTLGVLPMLGTVVVFAQQDDHRQQLAGRLAAMPLQGIKDCGILVENLNADAISGGLNERNLQRQLSERLSAIGVRTGDLKAYSPTAPYLYLSVLVSKFSTAGYAFSISLELHELVIPVRDRTAVFSGTTWQGERVAAVGRNALSSTITRTLTALVEEFRKDHSSVNPR